MTEKQKIESLIDLIITDLEYRGITHPKMLTTDVIKILKAIKDDTN